MEEGYKSKHDITPDSDSGEFSMSKSDTVTGKVTLIILLQRGRYNCHRVKVYSVRLQFKYLSIFRPHLPAWVAQLVKASVLHGF